MVAPLNPFQYSGPVPEEDVIARDAETEELVGLAAGGHNTRVQAPRRYGKTSLLRKVLAEADRQGLRTVYVDLYGVLSRADIADRVSRAYGRIEGRFRTVVRSALKEVQITITTPLGGLGVAAAPGSGDLALMRLLDLPEVLFKRDGVLTVVVFDEFQDLLRTEGETDALMRSVIQHHAHEAGYVFAGSQPGMMRELFDDRARAFYSQARPFDLGPLPIGPVADALVERFARHGRDAGTAIDPLLGFTRGHPQRTMQLAHHLFALTPARGAADEQTWLDALARTYEHAEPELRQAWDALEDVEQRVVAAIAERRPLLSGATLERFHLAKSTAQSARDRLLRNGQLLAAGRDGPFITDPLLGEWIAAGRRAPVEDAS
jgi:hypothetical protein